MEECNFMELMEEMAVQFTVNKEEHQLFVHDSRMISLTIQRQLVLDGAVFKDQLAELHKTASFVDKIYLDMPLNFEIFLPIRLPKPVVPTYDEKKRSVQFTRANYQHPFFFGNAVNFKCLNLLLQSELQRAISKLKTATSTSTGRTYDIKYSVLSLNDVPFVHQVVALDRDSNGKRFIRFDFILAVEFNGADMALPPYFKAPLINRWIAYGRMTVDEDPNPAEWAVLVPKWQDASPGAALISLNCMVMLYRLMSAQQCYLFTLPGSIKLAFVMATEERGLDFQQISIADLTITTMFHQVFGNLYKAVAGNTIGDKTIKSRRLMAIRKQLLRARGIYAMVADAVLRNSISRNFVNAYFFYVAIPPPPECFYQSLVEVRNTDTKLKRKRAKGTPGQQDSGVEDTGHQWRAKQFRARWQRKFTCQRR
ncbi:uncharacterized protein LOC6604841 [Drosophila sechellia]|uniref:uncharacterized protein LOC6604841 n=1 Tax=Drosophila sechellia TaxID=7238 RepID=UPI0013DDA5A1|nr:uncharacterized protein LOC6604841 [Drosophila sechellia]